MEDEAYMDNNLVSVVIMFLIGVAVFLAGWFSRRLIDRSKIVSAEELAEKIVREAQREGETQKKAAVLEAKDEWYKAKAKFEEDTQSTRSELDKLQRSVEKREENLNRKVEFLDKKELELDSMTEDVKKTETQVAERTEKLSRLIDEQNERLERIAGMNRDDAKKLLIKNMESDARLEAARMVKDIKDEARRQGDKEAKEVLTLAIQRCAADHVVESTVSVVNLPSDEMKGRIIGREGRNIRAFETATGIDVIVDDTPEAVILSGFDPVRREVARLALERLITDGRIHPGRIEEVVDKVVQGARRAHRRAGRGGVPRRGHPRPAAGDGQAPGQAPLPHQLRAERAPALQGGRLPLRADGRRARVRRDGRQAGGSPARHRQGRRPHDGGHARRARRRAGEALQ